MKDYVDQHGLSDYIIVTWPQVQDIMDEEWFNEECFLAVPNSVEQEWIGDSSYFVPKLKYRFWLMNRSDIETDDE